MRTGRAASNTWTGCGERSRDEYPELRTFFSSGSMVDAILNMGAPAPIDVQVSSRDLDTIYNAAQGLAAKFENCRALAKSTFRRT